MSIRIFRKAIGLLIVDIVIIIGIFVLQFRTDSSIIEKIGNLQFTFAKSEDQNKVISFKNKLNISYNGINFYCDDQHPAIYMDLESSSTRPASFVNYEKLDDFSYKLEFAHGISLVFELASEDPDASLAIIGDMPPDVAGFALPYNYSANMKLQKDDSSRAIVNGRKKSWEVSAHSLSAGYFGFSAGDYVATYTVHNETQKFTFDSIVELAIANSDLFNKNITAFKNNLIAAFKANNSESNLTEQIVVSYIAAQAEAGNFVAAVDEIPQSIKRSRQRTYLSAPYLNTLEEMNVVLEKTIKEQEKKITEAANTNSLDIFTVNDIAGFMCIHSNPEVVRKLLQSTAYTDISSLTIAQATGILKVFVELSACDKEYAKCLLPALDNCVQKITSACSYDGTVMTISENDTFLSVIQAIETGIALLRYGEQVNNQTLQKAGYVLVNSYLTESASFDLRTLSNLYPIVSYNNWYYPHFEKIADVSGHIIWAWTCAKSIKADTAERNALTLKIDFPENFTHYVIVKGIPAFKTIYIYNMAFRTDPRFETYNSSGYVYKQNSQTLLLKSRHKSNIETIRFEADGFVDYSAHPALESSSSSESARRESVVVPVTVVAEEKPDAAEGSGNAAGAAGDGSNSNNNSNAADSTEGSATGAGNAETGAEGAENAPEGEASDETRLEAEVPESNENASNEEQTANGKKKPKRNKNKN